MATAEISCKKLVFTSVIVVLATKKGIKKKRHIHFSIKSNNIKISNS